MLLIYVPRLTNRLGYTLNVLLHHLLHTDYSITTDVAYFDSYGGAKLCYGPHRLGDGLYIKSVNLLFSTSIEDHATRADLRDGHWTLYPVYGREADFPFDLLAATFFMVSRYEEYLPYRGDLHGRFPAEQSVACQKGFLDQPVVEQWAAWLHEKLALRYPDLPVGGRSYRFMQTVDIDEAWCYLHKGFGRTAMGLVKELFVRRDPAAARRRLRTLLHRQPDPYDTFDYILAQRQRVPGSHLLFFVLMADYGKFDRAISYLDPHMRDLLQHLGDHARLGIHPGYATIDEPARCDVEMQRLGRILHRDIVRARYHYIRLCLPRSYRILLHAGIRHDYSMGYPDAPGFRAGISSPYPFYDLERDLETELVVHPFCVMDTTLRRYLGLDPAAALDLCRPMVDAVRAVGGDFCCIFHNQNLSETGPWQGWRTFYEQLLDYAKPK